MPRKRKKKPTQSVQGSETGGEQAPYTSSGNDSLNVNTNVDSETNSLPVDNSPPAGHRVVDMTQSHVQVALAHHSEIAAGPPPDVVDEPGPAAAAAAGPEMAVIQLTKSNNGMGLSIIATQGFNQDKKGIYIKTVVKGGAAEMVSSRRMTNDRLRGNQLM